MCLLLFNLQYVMGHGQSWEVHENEKKLCYNGWPFRVKCEGDVLHDGRKRQKTLTKKRGKRKKGVFPMHDWCLTGKCIDGLSGWEDVQRGQEEGDKRGHWFIHSKHMPAAVVEPALHITCPTVHTHPWNNQNNNCYHSVTEGKSASAPSDFLITEVAHSLLTLFCFTKKCKERVVNEKIFMAEKESVTSCENHLCDASFHIAESH